MSWTHPGDTESIRYGDCPSVIAWTTPPQCCSVLPTRVDWHEVARRAATSTSGVANDSEELCWGGGAQEGVGGARARAEGGEELWAEGGK